MSIQRVFRWRRCTFVAAIIDLEPAEKGFKEDYKKEGGKRVTLNCASTNGDRLRGASTACDASGGIRVQSFDHLYGVRRET